MQQDQQLKKSQRICICIFTEKNALTFWQTLLRNNGPKFINILCSHRKEKSWQLGLWKNNIIANHNTPINEYIQLFYRKEGQKDEISFVFYMA